MFTVYINRFRSGNSIISTEQEMFTVPSTIGFPVYHPVVKASEDAADNFSFTMESDSPYYDALLPLKTLIRVIYDGDTIFYGRVLSIATSTAYQTKNVTCEGWYAFLNDSVYEGLPEKNRSNITVNIYFNKLISNHNTSVPDKAIKRGNVGVTLPSDLYKYEPSSWTQTASLISNLASNYGGHMKIRYNGNSTPYLDWYKYYARDLGNNRPSVTIGRNIIDISSDQDPDNIFTRVIPIGDSKNDGMPLYVDGFTYTDKNGTSHTHSGKAMPVSIIRSLYADSALTDDFHTADDYSNAENDYGIIYKPMSFSDADSQAKLWNYAKEWIKNSYYGLASSFTVKAVDMHIVDPSQSKILLGDCVNVTYPITRNGSKVWETKKLVCKSVQYDLFDPDNNNYTFGIPTDLLEHNKNNKKSSKGKSASEASAPKGFGGGGVDDHNITWKSIARMIGDQSGDPAYTGYNAYISFYNNGEISGTVTCYDPEEVTGDPLQHKDKWFTARLVGKITLPGKSVKWVAVSEERGIFAFINTGSPSPVTYWYSKKKGYSYEGTTPELSTFENIAQMIENDPDSTYGGISKANYFRNHGEVSGNFRCFDPGDVDVTAPLADKSKIFNAKIIGKISTLTYIGISEEYGVFACSPYRGAGAYRGICQVVHWYMRAKGASYDSLGGGTFTDENGDVFATDNGYLDGDKTVWMKPTTLTGYGSEGQILVGYDLTSPGDQWRVELNVPIQYTDENNQTQIADGFVSAHDFHVAGIPSFKTKLAVIDVAIVGVLRAQSAIIDDLEAVEANIETLTATKLTTTSLSSAITSLDNVTVKKLSVSNNGYISLPGGNGSVVLTGANMSNVVTNLRVKPNTTDTLQKLTYGSPSTWTDVGTFKTAVTLTAEYGGSDAGKIFTYKVTATPGGAKIGTFLLHLTSTRAYVTDADAHIRAEIANTYATNVTVAFSHEAGVVTATPSSGTAATHEMTPHTYSIAGVTKANNGNHKLSVLYVPDDNGTTLSIKVRNISAANRYWYYRTSDQTPTTYYTW